MIGVIENKKIQQQQTMGVTRVVENNVEMLADNLPFSFLFFFLLSEALSLSLSLWVSLPPFA